MWGEEINGLYGRACTITSVVPAQGDPCMALPVEGGHPEALRGRPLGPVAKHNDCDLSPGTVTG